jgi:hypothetical protein
MNRTPQPSTESHWTDSISNATLCNFFYVFFILFTVWAVVGVIGAIWLFATTPMSAKMMIALLFNLILTSGISITAALFHYLICDRALNPSHMPSSDSHMRLQTASQYEAM